MWGFSPSTYLYCCFSLLYVLLFCCCVFLCLYLCYFSVMFVFLSWLNNWYVCCLASTLINTCWIIIVIIITTTGIFFLVLLLLNQQWSPPLRLQVLDCSTSDLCDVPSIAAFCGISSECYCGMPCRFLTLFCYSGGPSYCHYDNTFCVPCLLYHSSIHSFGMCRMWRFLAVLRIFFHSPLLCTFPCHPSPATTLPSSLTSFCHLLGLHLSLVFPKFIYNTLLVILFCSTLCTCPNQCYLFNLIVSIIVGF